MSNQDQTPMSDIMESYRAIQAAARDRHAALAQEMRELEAICGPVVTTRNARSGNRRPRTEAERQAASAAMSARWARAISEGRTALAKA